MSSYHLPANSSAHLVTNIAHASRLGIATIVTEFDVLNDAIVATSAAEEIICAPI
jgi:hypothetical protein